MVDEHTHLSAEALAKAHRLEQEIRVAFTDQPVPEHDRIARPGTWFDEHGTMHVYENPEAIDIAQFLAGKRWSDLIGTPLITWNEAQSCLTFMTNEASVYYLPAFMLTAIYYYPKTQLSGEDFLFVKLMHPTIAKEMYEATFDQLSDEIPEELRLRYRSPAQQEAMEAHRLQRFDDFVRILSPAQQKAIKHFLQFMAETYPDTHALVARALEGYWDTVSQ